MGEVKPWEPVSYNWLVIAGDKMKKPIDWPCDEEGKREIVGPDDVMRLTLANSQRIIVRALSDERKAARRMRREPTTPTRVDGA